MEKLGLNEIRSRFRDFYVSKGHYAAGSASLIPKNDKSLLIINSGMAPLKPYFAGVETPPSKRMTTCQKCIRTGDIENVGKTARHGTFFEMLGNFSFGDYFKKESLTWGWEFITEDLKMPKDKLWATIYKDDEEAHDIWISLGMPEDHIVRLGKEDNFWEIGLGPCGPCSEIYFDRGEKYGCGKPDCKPGCECDRYVEFWNHVFTQFSKEEDGSYSNLAHPNIDTGMGLERIACIMQGVDSIFDVDTVRHILNAVTEMAGVKYEDGDEKADMSIRIVTDHLRSMVFMIADGILPSNEGRGYVLRRLIRRASRHGRLLGIQEPEFLSQLADKVIEVSGEAYPELVEKRDYIKKMISLEEERFGKALDNGLHLLFNYVADMEEEGRDTLDGESAFKLYDTYGFPVELTEEILEEKGKKVDMDGFREHMAQQKEMARAGQRDTSDDAWKDAAEYDELPATEFVGYDSEQCNASILYVGRKDQDHALVITDRTPFYATSGGQLHDIGTITAGDIVLSVEDVVKENGIFLHIISHEDSDKAMSLEATTEVTMSINGVMRHRTSRGHSATHLLQQALRDVLGSHVQQAGSYVDDNYLRFDFSHFQPMTQEELRRVEDIVNEKIDEFLTIKMEEMPIEDAKKLGAMAIFGEKYGSIVRVVSMGDYSVEFCGGTHLDNTGKIGAFKITGESGVASGVRRIEAITGTAVTRLLDDTEDIVDQTADALKTNRSELARRAAQVVKDNKDLQKEIKSLESGRLADSLDDIIASGEELGKARLITGSFDGIDVEQLREMADAVKEKVDNAVILFASVGEGKAALICGVSEKLVGEGYHAGKLIKEAATAAGGGGGGKSGMAQAGIKDPSRIGNAFDRVREILSKEV
ncbi:alanine--tRNA ligase [Mobilibacterium timonense]|uniref:alanine--tRNA ligase n=1 Tax=Mobilibacterium timonense TaxID=1871012 RepID=UPI000985072F|nr:alanine--tRNA ligase [Mobilibacterium timonense]MBM6991007.1 alanine--tRNA ligase [Mobilibacterium timonense]